MKQSFFKSFSTRLSLRFTLVLTCAVVILSITFLLFTRSLVNKAQEKELIAAEGAVYNRIEEFRNDKNVVPRYGATLGTIEELPYYLTYIVYDTDESLLLATNDPFLPFLEDSRGHSRRYFVKNYFFDGDLNILYFAKPHCADGVHNIIVAVVLDMDNNKSADIFRKLPSAMLLMIIPILIISFLLSLLITRNTINPVVKITKEASAMNLENLTPLPVSGCNDELDQLSQTFNALFDRIKKDYERERQFSSDVSHELNTPLTVISGQTGLLLRWGKDKPEQLEKSLNAIKTEAKTMQAIIANLLQMSRIESGRIKPQFAEVSVKNLFSWLVEEFAAVNPKMKISFQSSVDSIISDSEMLHQILTVLISNSAKYAGADCNVELSAFKEGDKIIIRQKDDGPGFSEEALPHIFERFFRADEAHSRKISGSGLGLAIAQTLCSALGAKIKACNVEPHGAGFEMEFKAQPSIQAIEI
ncbi:MAG: HAMP domain-containing histidine kinase [Treponema sp.]|nr:HAMP domain-containing histidine kinase [Treponema sp.]